MTNRTLYLAVPVLLVIVVAATYACTREYSREGLDVTTPPVTDTTTPPPPPPDSNSLYVCGPCIGMDKFEENRWSFKAGNAFHCGPMDTALVDVNRTAFTFFGPSSCSSDTSMVVTVYMDNYTLTQDLNDVVFRRVDFRYTKWGAPKYLLVSQPGTPFNLTIESYNHQTRMTVGTFSGYAYKGDGTLEFVESGKFKVKLH